MSSYEPILSTEEPNESQIWTPNNQLMEEYSEFIKVAEKIFDYERKIIELNIHLENINSLLSIIEDDVNVGNILIETVTKNTKGRINIYNKKIAYVHKNKHLFKEYDEYEHRAKRFLIYNKLIYNPDAILISKDILKNVKKEDRQYFDDFKSEYRWMSYFPFSIIKLFWS